MPQRKKAGVHSVPMRNVRITGGFWKERIDVNRKVTLPTEYRLCKKTGRIDAFSLKWKPGDPNAPHHFWDSDVAKWLEAVAYSLAVYPDKKMENLADSVIDLIAGAQQEDGYLNTHFTLLKPGKRWNNLRDSHELYCAGHLIEAAVAYYKATGKSKFMDVMRRYADYIDSVFGREKGKKCGYPGHEEIELALVKLYRATGTKRYLDLAKFFIDERGRYPHYYDLEALARGENPALRRTDAPGLMPYDNCQAHIPVRKQAAADGHAVRALYLFSGMADVAVEAGDKSLLDACKRLWRNIVDKRMYITGGVGSTRWGERFTFDYDLPNETAYAETCANIALVFFAHRMLNIETRGEYADVMERALFNSVISGVSLDGKKFFYDNLLAVCPDAVKFRKMQKPGSRQEWFECACCPPNLARLLAGLGEYIYSQSKNAAYVHLYMPGSVELSVGGGSIILEQKTDYPWSGGVSFFIKTKAPVKFTLALRIPGWCRKAGIRINGKNLKITGAVSKGYARIRRIWSDGDKVELDLAMPVERVKAHPYVRENAGRAAVMRGPLVYCLEEIDNGVHLSDILLPKNPGFREVPGKGVLSGMTLIESAAFRHDVKKWGNALYRQDTGRRHYRRVKITFVPVFAWNNRGPGEMLIWIPE